jgi:hypothetical protein
VGVREVLSCGGVLFGAFRGLGVSSRSSSVESSEISIAAGVGVVILAFFGVPLVLLFLAYSRKTEQTA